LHHHKTITYCVLQTEASTFIVFPQTVHPYGKKHSSIREKKTEKKYLDLGEEKISRRKKAYTFIVFLKPFILMLENIHSSKRKTT